MTISPPFTDVISTDDMILMHRDYRIMWEARQPYGCQITPPNGYVKHISGTSFTEVIGKAYIWIEDREGHDVI